MVRTIVLVLGTLLCPRGFAAEVAVVGFHAPSYSPQEVAKLTQDMLSIIQESGGVVAVGPERLRERLRRVRTHA